MADNNDQFQALLEDTKAVAKAAEDERRESRESESSYRKKSYSPQSSIRPDLVLILAVEMLSTPLLVL
jgi:hypothetical protein